MSPTFGKDDTINRMQRKGGAMLHVLLRRSQVDLVRHCACTRIQSPRLLQGSLRRGNRFATATCSRFDQGNSVGLMAAPNTALELIYSTICIRQYSWCRSIASMT